MRSVSGLLLLATWLSLSVSALAQRTDVVVLNHTTTVECQDALHTTVKESRSFKVMNEKAAAYASIALQFNASEKLTTFSGSICSADGKVLRKVKRSDLIRSDYSQSNLADDVYNLLFSYYPPSYPIFVHYEWESAYSNGFLSFPAFFPQPDYNMEVKHATYRLTLPQGMACRYKVQNTDSVVRETTTDKGQHTYTISFDNLAAQESEPRSPSLINRTPHVLFYPNDFAYQGTEGNQSTWQSLGKWAYALQEGRQVLPDKFKPLLHQMTDTCRSARSKVEACYRFLEKTTRYVSIQLGIGGYQSAAAADVCRTGFGDCKGLTNYLRAMLQEIGIPSDMTLISTAYRRLYKDFANLSQLNHAILRVPLPGDTLWIECTNPSLPLGYIHQDIAGHDCLVLSERGGELATLPTYADDSHLQRSVVNVTLATDGSADMTIEQSSHMFQYEDMLAVKRAKESLQREYLLSLLNKPTAVITSMAMEEHKDSYVDPRITLSATLADAHYATGRGTRLFVPLCPIHQHVSALSASTSRTQDLEIAYGFTDEDTIRIQLPAGYVIESKPQDLTVSFPFGEFVSQLRVDDGMLVLYNRRRERHGTYPKTLYNDYLQFRQTIADHYQSQKIVIRKEQ